VDRPRRHGAGGPQSAADRDVPRAKPMLGDVPEAAWREAQPPGGPCTLVEGVDGAIRKYASRLRGGGMCEEAFVLQPGEGRSIDLGGFLMTVKADAETKNAAFTLLEATEPPHFGPPMHIHRDAAEAFYVLEGEYIIFIGDQETRCPAGSFVYIPPGAVHGFRVGAHPSKKLNLYVPKAMVGYFDELAAAIASGDVDDGALANIAERYGMEVLGPVPEGYI
jgi:quercetin dioxygenase-like cupin family protein